MHFSTIEEVKIKQDLDNMDNIDFISADDFIFIVSVKVFVQPKEKENFLKSLIKDSKDVANTISRSSLSNN